MNKIIKSVIIANVITVTQTSYAQSIPQGFEAIVKDKGVQVYKKEYRNGKQEYVTVVNIVNATITNLTGEIVNTPNGIRKKTTIDAATTLRNFGASVTAMLDGGSTSIFIDGKPVISTNRLIPHAIAIYSGR